MSKVTNRHRSDTWTMTGFVMSAAATGYLITYQYRADRADNLAHICQAATGNSIQKIRNDEITTSALTNSGSHVGCQWSNPPQAKTSIDAGVRGQLQSLNVPEGAFRSSPGGVQRRGKTRLQCGSNIFAKHGYSLHVSTNRGRCSGGIG
jgi:hypothetical protein